MCARVTLVNEENSVDLGTRAELAGTHLQRRPLFTLMTGIRAG